MTNQPILQPAQQPAQIDPAVAKLAEQTGQLQQRIAALEPVVRFTGLREQIEDKAFDNTVSQLPESLKQLRTRGYKFEESLEQVADELKQQWATLHPLLRQRLEEQATLLGPELESVMSSMMQLTQFASDPTKAQPVLAHVQATVADLESRSKLAMGNIDAPFTAYQTKVKEFRVHLQGIKMLTQAVEGLPFQSDPSARVDPAVAALATQVSQLQQRIKALEPVVRFTSLREQIEDKAFDNTVSQLPESLKQQRTRGYKFERSLEQTADELKQQWATLHPLLSQRLEEQATLLGLELESARSSLVQLTQFASDPIKAQPVLARAQATVAGLETRSKQATEEIRASFTAHQTKVKEFLAHLQEIERILTQVDSAKFQLQHDEGAVMAAQATWIKDKDDHPEGFLYLTNQRILFEQRQTVATKKFLFVTTEKKLVDQMLLDAPVDKILEARGSKESSFLRSEEDHIRVTFDTGVPVSQADFHVQEPGSVVWQELITRAKTGNLL